jgi:hypothetical protein
LTLVSIRDILTGEGEKNMNTVKVVETFKAQDGTINRETTRQPEQTRVRLNFTVSTKGMFQADITSEADTKETAFENMNKAIEEFEAVRQGLIATGKLGVKE